MTMKSLSRIFFIGMVMILGSGFLSATSVAQDSSPEDVVGSVPLLEGLATAQKQYLVQLSGTVMNETFSGVRALLTLSGPNPLSKYNNPYLLVIEGFPKQNSVNSFFWSGEDSHMRALANAITCDIKQTYVKEAGIYFYFLSPALFRYTGEQEESAVREEVNRKAAEKVGLPTFIRARAGQLKLRIHSNSVSGTVWMKGYDPAEKAYVLYSARLSGKKVYHVRPKVEQKKGTPIRE
jgi:hypothetical protein